MRTLALLFVTLQCLACARATRGSESEAGFGSTPRAALGADRVPLDGEPSLFRTDTEVLSDSAIRRILEYRLELPSSSRLAVLQVGARSLGDWRWSGEPRFPTEVSAKLLDALQASDRVRSASALPSLLVPRQRTVGYLREAAARYQADLLLVYRTDCHTFERARIFAADVVKAACVVEAVLIDTRTGIVPFTSTVSRDFEAKKSKTDTNFRETVQRVELEAVGAGLAELGGRVAAFLSPTAARR